MTKSCDNCKWDEQGLNPCDWCCCQNYLEPVEPEKKKTNADRIRAMPDEELAAFIGSFADCRFCLFQDEVFPECAIADDGCCKIWTDWLKQECEA